MKIQLDTTAKTIKVEESVKLGEFIKQIKKIIPDWEEYKLETNTVINWNNYPVYTYPYWAWSWGQWPYSTLTISSSGCTTTAGSGPYVDTTTSITATPNSGLYSLTGASGNAQIGYNSSDFAHTTGIINLEI